MSTQTTLRFGSLTLCNPSNGRDGYRTPEHEHPLVDADGITIPGSKGRVKLVTGVAGEDASSLKLSFECESYFSSDTSLDTWLKSVGRTAMNAANNLQTVTYGYLDGGGTFTAGNCDMKFRLDKTGRAGDGYFFAQFTASFTQYVPDD
jgi:hypothetical protein